MGDQTDPERGGRGAEGSAETRERLLDAVIRIASSQGMDKVTWRSVGAEAGLSHSLVRFYFGSGDEMIAQALERAARLDVAESEVLAADVDTFLSDFVETIAGEGNRGLLQYDYLLRAVRGAVPVERVRAIYDFYLEQVGGTLTNVGIEDPDGSVAALVLAAIDGLILQHAVYGSAERTEAAMARLREVLQMLARPQTDV